LDELNLKGKNIGVEYEAYGLTGRNTIQLNNSLKNYCKLEDKSELISKLRVIKSKEEIAYVRKAAELADRALDEVWKNAKAGVSEGKILAEMQRVIFESGGDYPANEFIIGSGHNALLCRYQAEKRILSNPDQLTIEWAGTYKHYHSAMFRTIPIGKADQKHYKMYEACIEDGFAFVSSTRLRNRDVLRICTINPRTSEADIRSTLDRLATLGDRLLASKGEQV